MNLVENTPLFHGSYKIVSDPQVDYEPNDLEKNRREFRNSNSKDNESKDIKTSDFGKGFYLTDSRKHAREWAKIKGIGAGSAIGYVSEFRLKKNIVPSAEIKIFDGYSEEWLQYIMDCRMNRFTKHYGLVIGYVADAKTYRLINSYEKNLVYKDDRRGEYVDFRRLKPAEKKSELWRLISGFEESFIQLCFKEQDFIKEYLEYKEPYKYFVNARR